MDKDSVEEWLELIEAVKRDKLGNGLVLSEDFTVKFTRGEQPQQILVPQGSEVSFFCFGKTPGKRTRDLVQTEGTFFMTDQFVNVRGCYGSKVHKAREADLLLKTVEVKRITPRNTFDAWPLRAGLLPV